MQFSPKESELQRKHHAPAKLWKPRRKSLKSGNFRHLLKLHHEWQEGTFISYVTSMYVIIELIQTNAAWAEPQKMQFVGK